jgi:hypothetical protein
MARYTFAQLDLWALKVRHRMNFVLQHAVNRLIKTAQTPIGKGGKMPVDTGALRSSLLSELNGNAGAIGADSYVFVAGAMEAGDYAWFKWTMEYAYMVNQGVQGRPGAHFVEWAARQWQTFVNEGVQLAKARFP